MKKMIALMLAAIVSSAAHAATIEAPVVQPMPETDFVQAQTFVTMNGEYRICKEKPGARTLVMEGMCLWEMPIPAEELKGKNSVAGLKIERADTESVDGYLQRHTAQYNSNIVSVDATQTGLLIYYTSEIKTVASR